MAKKCREFFTKQSKARANSCSTPLEKLGVKCLAQGHIGVSQWIRTLVLFSNLTNTKLLNSGVCRHSIICRQQYLQTYWLLVIYIGPLETLIHQNPAEQALTSAYSK